MRTRFSTKGARSLLLRTAVAAAGLAAVASTAPPGIAAPPPAPTPAQIAALRELEQEAVAYEQGAREHRGLVSRIVQHHYEERRRRVLAALDAEIAIEKRGLRDARAEAARKLEAFVAAHSGPNAQPENTPDAMFRLAALHEERAREELDSSADLAAGLAPAIALYRRILAEFPQYREIAGVHYYLGHALDDAGRAAEAQQVFRALVCKNHYAYPAAAGGGLSQDHDRAYWRDWEAGRTSGHGKADRGPDATFQTPYPDDCQPIAQRTPPGQEPRYLAEVWWLIGDHHFNGADTAGGPFALNRAEAAYRHSLAWRKPPVHGVAMYKRAWTLFKQQRYEAAVRQFVDLLRYADEQQRLTGDAGADFRAEAHAYVAGALTYLDFTGPAPDEPFAARADVLDTETDPRVAEQKLRVAISRVTDGRLIPQNEPWTPAIYRALAQELKELGHLHSMIELDELTLKKWPLYRDAPVIQAEIAEGWERLAALSRDGTRDRAEASARALEAHTRLSAYVGAMPWPDAHKDDGEALRTAERLADSGLRRAAADHTNAGNALFERAHATSDKASRGAALEQALSEYRLAAQAWGGLSARDGDPDVYERRYWLADARHRVVQIEVELDRSPSAADFEAARRAAVDVRDSHEDDRYLEPAAHMVVDIARQALVDRQQAFVRTGGREGVERRDRIKTTGSGASERVVSEPLPREVLGAIAAREEYIQRVPPARDPAGNRALYAYQIGEHHFLYGQLDVARRRLQAAHESGCGKDPYGFMAWRRLLSIAALTHDVERVRALAEGALAKSCAVSDEDRLLEQGIAREALGAAGYEDAKTAFERAQQMPDGPERIAAWRKAAALYRATLERAPDGDAAPEAAINGAYAYKQAGDPEPAIALYETFIRTHGSEEKLARLEKGDPGTTPPRPPDPARYAQRVKYLSQAHEALARTYVALLDHRRAADAYDATLKNARFDAEARRAAARNAALLFSRLGERDKMTTVRAAFLRLDPPAGQRAELDYLVAAADLAAWDERGLDEGENRAARLKAMAAMDAYQAANKGEPAAAAFVVRAAYHGAKLRRAGRDSRAAERCRDAVAAFEKLRGAEPGRGALGTPEAEMAAECAYTLLDERIEADLGHPRYDGSIDKVVAAYRADLAKARAYHDKLQDVIERYGSPVWAVAARARQGSLYDACRTALYFARKPSLKLFTPREDRLLAALSRVDPERADAFTQKRVEAWQAARDRELAEADQVMVRRYAEAVIAARAWKLRTPAADAALQRLAMFTGLLGDVRIRASTQGVVDPATGRPFDYADGLFLRTRPGMSLSVAPDLLATPPPAAPR